MAKLTGRMKLPEALQILGGLLLPIPAELKLRIKLADVVVVSHSHNFRIVKAARRLGRPAILDTSVLQTQWVTMFRKQLSTLAYQMRYRFYVMADEVAYASSSAVAVTSEGERREFRKHYRKHSSKCFVLENGIEVEAFYPDSNEAMVIRKQIGAEDDVPVIGFLGHLLDSSNLTAARFIVDSLAEEIWKRHPKARFLIVGKYRKYDFRDVRDPRIVLTGFVEHPRPYLNAMDVFVAPFSIGRGSKVKVLSAMSCGTPVVATLQSCSGFSVTHGKNIHIVGLDSFAEALSGLLLRPDYMKKIADEGRELVVNRYSWRRVSADLLSVIDSHLKSVATATTGT